MVIDGMILPVRVPARAQMTSRSVKPSAALSGSSCNPNACCGTLSRLWPFATYKHSDFRLSSSASRRNEFQNFARVALWHLATIIL